MAMPIQTPGRTVIACLFGCSAAPFVFAATAGLTGTAGASWLAAVLVAAGLAAVLRKHPVVALDWTGCSRAFLALGVAAAILAIALISRLTVFMVDPAKTSWSSAPSSDFELRHLCLTAYFVAADVVRSHPNVYDESLYELPGGDPTRPRRPKMLGIFSVDQYEYPPPFLLVPRALSWAAPGLLSLRALWFGLSGLVLLGALVVAARALDPPGATRALVLAPFVLGAPATLSTLQKGNVQLLVIALAVLAMALFANRRRAAGGAVLAFISVAKLYPGLLVVYLLARREWRAALWTSGFAAFFVALTLADVGWAPFAAFRGHLPGLLSGEAFPAFRNPAAYSFNVSIPGLLFKAKLFGITDAGFGAMRAAGTLYTLVALAVTVLIGLRARDGASAPIVCLTVLVFATLRSPFLPWTYGTFPALWLATLLAATAAPRQSILWTWIAAVFGLGVVIPIDAGLSPQAMAILTTVPQALMIGVAILGVRQTLSPQVHVEPTSSAAAYAGS
jgi:hypothetical protein